MMNIAIGHVHRFNHASSFNQNLCNWGSALSSSSHIVNIFVGSACPTIYDPHMFRSPPGPFCYDCGVPSAAPSTAPSAVPSPTPSAAPTFPGACQCLVIWIRVCLKHTLNTFFYPSGSVPDKVRASGRCQFRRVWI